jgi:hypothetical protein
MHMYMYMYALHKRKEKQNNIVQLWLLDKYYRICSPFC